jgi:glycosyltransferase involved in cell wall biosynthesis
MIENVSVVVSVYSKDRLGYLLGCIDSLRRQSIKPNEVIAVLDNKSNLIDFSAVS